MTKKLGCFVDFDLEYGDVEVEVRDQNQTVTIHMGQAAISLPLFFSNLTNLSSYKQTRFKLEQFGNSDYHIFVRDSNRIRIEEVRKPGGREVYVFPLTDFLFALKKAFRDVFDRLQKESQLSVQDDSMSHMNEEVQKAFTMFVKNAKL